MNYREFEVPDQLQRQVQSVWQLKGRAAPAQVDTIYPDGCCELIVHLGQPPRMFQAPDQWFQQASCLFAGQHRSAIRLAQQETIE